MADVNSLRGDVKYWTEELIIRQKRASEAEETELRSCEEAVREAAYKLKDRQDELMRAEEDEIADKRAA